ncbi:MAG: hypothetical protein AB7I34_06690 [Rhizobiaceae bacterium]
MAEAAAFRDRMKVQGRARLDLVYGQAERNVFDLFLPAEAPLGLLVFVHGGFWLAYDKLSSSHFAEGPTNAGFAVALPSYRRRRRCASPTSAVQSVRRSIVARMRFQDRSFWWDIRPAGTSSHARYVGIRPWMQRSRSASGMSCRFRACMI